MKKRPRRTLTKEGYRAEAERLRKIIISMEREMDAELSWPPDAKCHQCEKPPEVAVEIFCCMEHVAK